MHFMHFSGFKAKVDSTSAGHDSRIEGACAHTAGHHQTDFSPPSHGNHAQRADRIVELIDHL